MENMYHAAQLLKEDLIRDRRTLHMRPEIGFDLPETTAYVSGRLREMGLEAQEMDSGGLVVSFGNPGKTILLRADMDALPMKENGDCPFRSQNEYGHLCGHDMHTAMLLGAARLLATHREELNGTVRLMFQPAEERGAGAKAMVEAGVLRGVDAAIALHVDPVLEPGKVSFIKGTATAFMDSFYIEVQGRGGHGSTPHLAVDPLQIVNTIYMILNGLVGKEIDPQETAILTIGRMGGGTAVNIIPDTAVLEGAVRCYHPDVREHLVKRVYEIIEQTTQMLRGSYTVTKCVATPSVCNDNTLCDTLMPYLEQVVGAENVLQNARPFTGTEDFAHVSKVVPAMYFHLGAGAQGNAPLHNPNVVFREEAMPVGSALLANCAIGWLKEN